MYEMKTLTTVEAAETKSVLANHCRYAVVVSSSTTCENVPWKTQNGLAVLSSSSDRLTTVEPAETRSVLANHCRYAVVVSSSTTCENVPWKTQNGLAVLSSS